LLNSPKQFVTVKTAQDVFNTSNILWDSHVVLRYKKAYPSLFECDARHESKYPTQVLQEAFGKSEETTT
jgi:hypothetical protein